VSCVDDVLAFRDIADSGDVFRPGSWPDDLPYRADLSAVEGPLLRQHVFDAFSDSIHRGCVYALVWGYPRGTLYEKRSKTVETNTLWKAVLDLGELVAGVESLRAFSKGAKDTIARLNKQSGLGTASTSKVAYFAELDTSAGLCCIYDVRVRKAIKRLPYPELSAAKADLPLDKSGPDFYEKYLHHLAKLAKLIGKATTTDDVERFLFVRGGEKHLKSIGV